MEQYDRVFHNLFDSPKPGVFVFCERVREEAVHWDKRHEDALKGSFMNRQGRKEVTWPEMPQDFEEWEPKKKKKSVKKSK
jgi:O-methyltransferase involved in polyketide biosynthesis